MPAIPSISNASTTAISIPGARLPQPAKSVDPEKLVAATFAHAKSYSQVVIGIGYASIYAIWGFTKAYLLPWEVLWCALLVTFSVFAYVLVEILNTIVMAVLIFKASRKKDAAEAARILQMNESGGALYWGFFAVIWPVSFATGVGAALILMQAFVRRIIGL